MLAGCSNRLDGLFMHTTDLFLALPLFIIVIILFRETPRVAFGPETASSSSPCLRSVHALDAHHVHRTWRRAGANPRTLVRRLAHMLFDASLPLPETG